MRRIIAVLSCLLSLTVLSVPVQAQSSQCPAVDCDCAAIPDANAKAICESAEARIKKGCAANRGQPTEFCGVHGPAGRPLALSIAKSLAEPLPAGVAEGATAENLQVAQWALQQDAELIGPRIKAGDLPTAYQMAQLLSRGQETLFQRQRGYIEAGAELVVSANGFTEDWRKLAEQLLRFARELETTGNAGKLRAQLIRLAAEIYEMCGYWQARTGRFGQAAQWYKTAAGLAEDLAAAAAAEKAPAKITDFYRAQASARWHRATLNYWQASDAAAAQAARERAAQLEAASQ